MWDGHTTNKVGSDNTFACAAKQLVGGGRLEAMRDQNSICKALILLCQVVKCDITVVQY